MPLTFDEWYKKKKKEEEETQSFDEWYGVKYGNRTQTSKTEVTEQETESALDWRKDEIAPVKNGGERKWFQKGAFDDGYQFGDLSKTILGTFADVSENVNTAVLDATENLIDTTAYGVGIVGGLFDKDFKDDVGDFIAKEILKPKESGKVLSDIGNPLGWANLLVNDGDTEENSVLGDKSDELVQSGSHLIGSAALQAVGVPTWLTMGVNAFGSEAESAFQQDATFGEAGISAGISAVAEVVFEKLSSGIKFKSLGGTGDEWLQKFLKNNITNKVGRTVAKYATDMVGEGTEEVLTEIVSAKAKQLTYMDDKEFNEIISSEDLFDAFIGGAVISGIAGGGQIINSKKSGRDYVTGLTDSEEKVVKKLYEDTIAEREQDGTPLTTREKNKLYDDIVEKMDKGDIEIDTIEEVLGGKTFEEYKSITEREKSLTNEISKLENMPNERITVKQKERLVEARKELANLTGKTELKTKLSDEVYGIAKNSRLVESYNEKARKGQAFEADLTQYTGKQKEAIERAVKSGVLNNTNKSHALVNTLSKIEADKGIVFDYTDNAKLKESGFAIEGKTVNGFEKNGTVTLNVQSAKSWQSTVGHEITHVLEGTEAYGTLQESLFKYAESKGELATRRNALTKLYNGIEADIDKELTADLVGDYLFSDKDFINHLTGNRTLFQKVYDEIKYLCKVATGKQLTEIEKVRREFDKAWKQLGLNESLENEATDAEIDDVNYSVSVEDKQTLDFLNEQVSRGEYNAETNPNGGYYVTYKSMSYWGEDENGNAILRSPMAEYVDGELSNAYLIPKDKSKLNWYQATETLDENTGLPSGLMVKTKKEGNKSFSYLPAAENQDLIAEDWSNLYFNLQKKVLKNGKWVKSDVPARYNPYEHSSNSMLNDQFSAAYLRDNLVTVKMYVPISEDNGAFRAKWSKDPTGWADWKTGTVAGKINKQKDLQRKVYLSRYAAPVEIVPDSEVAQAYKEYIDGTDVTIPDNVVSPSLLNELKKAGVPIEESGKVKYSVSENDTYSRIFEMQTEVGKLRRAIEEIELTDDFKAKQSEIFNSNDDIEIKINKYLQWLEESEYGKLKSRRDALEAELENLRKVVREEYSNKEIQKEKEAIAKSGLSEADYFRKQAVKEFGYTPYFYDAGYIIPNGKMLNFSGEKGKHFGSRGQDHRAIGSIYATTAGTDALNRFIKDGNIRIMAESPAIDLSTIIEPTKEQYATIREFIYEYANKEYFCVDLTDESGKVIGSLEYENRINPTRILNDIKHYYATGEIREQSDIDKFRFSLSEDSNGNELSLAVQKRFANSKAVDENGNLKVLYHGTYNGEFYTFDKSKGSVEGDFGSGFYFTDNESDVENNYEGGGADFENKVARRAEQIEFEEEIEYHEAEKKAREELYKGSNKHTVYLNIENPAIVGETYLFEYDSYAEQYDREDYDSDEDYEGDVEQLIADDIDQIIWDVDRNIDIYSTDGIAEVLWNAVNEGGIGIEELKSQINNLYLEDNNGNLVGNEVTRQIIESLGYDGIIDNTVSSKFNMNLEEGTMHYIVFKPNQIKSIDNQNPTDDPDIRKSLSNEDEQIAPVGNYSTPLNETALAPTKEVVAENTTSETKLADDFAPITEEEANALQDELFNSITDVDAPPEVETVYDSMPDTTALDDKALQNIGKSLRDTLSLTPQETKAIQEIVQEYSTTETPNKDNLFKTIKEKFGEKVWKEKNQDLAEVKRFLRTSKVNVSAEVKSDIADYKDFRKSLGSKLGTSKNGLPIDVAYQQLVGMYPEYFGEDIWNETDQFLRMAEVASMDLYKYESYPLDDEVIQEAVNIVLNEVRGYKENLTRIAAEETAEEALDSIAPPKAEQLANGSRGDALLNQSLDNHPIQTVEDRINENIRAVEGEIADNKILRRESIAKIDKEIERLSNEYLAKKDKNTQVANKLVSRIAKLHDNKARIDANYAKRISDLEARVERMKDPKFIRAKYKQAKMQEHADWAANLVGDTSTWVDKKIGLQYATNTERRNLRDIVRDENGNKDIARADAIDDALNGQYNREEAAKKRELAQVRGKYADLKITKAEDTYIQMLGELRGNPDTTLTERVVNEYYEKHKNKIDKAKVDKVIELARQDYDNLLNRVNEALREQGMKEIPYRKGYFPHFTEPKQNFIQKLLNWKTQDNEIPTSIAGLTETFKPVKSWQSFDKTRYSDETDYSFTKGFDSYSEGALDWIHHLDTLQKRRAVENHIRFTHSDEGIKARIKEVYASEEVDANEAQAQIEHILSEAKNPLNNFVQDFTTHTNILAGKKNSLDRTVEQATNRHIYSVMTNVQNRMSANMVLANVRSALTNFIPITQSWAQVSPMRSLQATKDTIANAIKDDGTIEKSTFLTNRLREVDKLYKTNWDKVLDKAGIMFEVVDNFSSQVIWRSKYNQNLANGMSESEAIANADQFAESVMAGRSKGNEPTLFNAKNPLVKAFTMFQLEVNNQYGYLFKDVPNDLKAETNHWKFNLAKGYTTAFVGAYVYNALLEKVAGSGAALDPIGIIEDLLRDLGLFDDDEEKEPEKVVTNLVDNVVEELPFVGGLFGGGRIPISSALPYEDDGLTGFIEDMGTLGEGGLKNFGKEMMNPLLNVGLPVGGGQIKKTVKGLQMFNTDEDHPVAGSYTDSGNLRFPVEDTVGNRIQAGIFGQWANENARDYIENGRAPLSPKNTQEYIDVDLPIADYWKYRDGLKGLKKNAEKADYINSLDIEDWQKNLLLNNILDRKEAVDMSNYDDYGSYEEFDYAQKNPEKYAVAKSVGGYNSYKTYSTELNDIKADKDSSGKTITGSRKEKVVEYINNLDADYETKIILLKYEYPSDDTYNYEIIEYLNNREDLTYDELVTIYTELGFTVNNGRVYWD